MSANKEMPELASPCPNTSTQIATFTWRPPTGTTLPLNDTLALHSKHLSNALGRTHCSVGGLTFATITMNSGKSRKKINRKPVTQCGRRSQGTSTRCWQTMKNIPKPNSNPMLQNVIAWPLSSILSNGSMPAMKNELWMMRLSEISTQNSSDYKKSRRAYRCRPGCM